LLGQLSKLNQARRCKLLVGQHKTNRCHNRYLLLNC
jgi:hypothetical protein